MTDEGISKTRDEEVVAVIRDVADRKGAEAAAKRRLEGWQLVSEITAKLMDVRPSCASSAVEAVLGEFAQFLNVDRIYLNLMQQAKPVIRASYQWCAEGLDPFPFVDVSLGQYAWAFQTLRRRTAIRFESLDQLPHDAQRERELWTRGGVKSILGIPLVAADGLAGFLGLSAERLKETWDDDEVAIVEVLAGMIFNIVRRWESETKVRRSEAKLKLAQSIASIGNWSWEVDLNRAEWSDEVYRIFKAPRKAPSFDLARSFVHPADLDHWDHEVASAVAEQRPFKIEFRAVRADGETIWVRNQTRTVSDRDGRFIGYEGTVQDITAQKDAESNLALFRRIAESSQIAIAVSDPNGRLIYINPAHTRLFGRTLAEARHANYREFYPPESVDVLERVVAPALERGEEWEGIIDAFDATGRRFPLWERASTVRGSDGKMVCAFGFMQDVTKRVRLKELAAEIAEAERIKLRRELHDTVCQRLAGAGMLADHLREDLEESPGGGAQRVDEIARLIRESLNEAHLIGQQMEPLPDAPGALLKSLEDLAARITGMYNVPCRVMSRRCVELSDRAAGNQLMFIAQEAAANAARHADAACIGISLFRRGRAVVLRVQDNGRGMPKKKDKRNGMGIKILHERAELIGAKLSIQQPKKGGTIVECVWKPPAEQGV